MIKGIIFDADGTLLDSMMIWREIGPRFLGRYNIVEEDTSLMEKFLTMSMEEACAMMKQMYPLSQSEEEIKEEMLGIIFDFYKNEVPAKAGVIEFLEEVKRRKMPMTIASSSDIRILSVAFERLGMTKYFDEIFTCSGLGTNKRIPYIYEKAANRMGTKISETAVFEDSLFAMTTAKNGGFVLVGVEDEDSRDKSKAKRALADFYIDDYSDMTAFWEFAK